MIRLDIFSDPICPWCYIGKANLDRALEAHAGHPFEIEWHPFQLNPDMAAEGADRRAYLEARFGGKQNAVRVYARVSEAAAAAGVTINFETMNRVPNTLDAHRLIHWAGLEGRQTAMVATLSRCYVHSWAVERTLLCLPATREPGWPLRTNWVLKRLSMTPGV